MILRTARIEGDVHYDSLTIEQGAEVDGRFQHRVHSAAGEAVFPLPSEDGEPRLTLAS